jgi:hypothetical protein
MKFGISEMREFAENHEDERVYLIFKRMEEARSKMAQWCDEVNRLNEFIKRQNQDWCDMDEAIKKQALRVLDAKRVEGDKWHVPRDVELVELIVEEYIAIKEQLEVIEARGKANAQERIALIQENKILIDRIRELSNENE